MARHQLPVANCLSASRIPSETTTQPTGAFRAYPRVVNRKLFFSVSKVFLFRGGAVRLTQHGASLSLNGSDGEVCGRALHATRTHALSMTEGRRRLQCGRIGAIFTRYTKLLLARPTLPAAAQQPCVDRVLQLTPSLRNPGDRLHHALPIPADSQRRKRSALMQPVASGVHEAAGRTKKGQPPGP